MSAVDVHTPLTRNLQYISVWSKKLIPYSYLISLGLRNQQVQVFS